jgi:hypothetical protein
VPPARSEALHGRLIHDPEESVGNPARPSPGAPPSVTRPASCSAPPLTVKEDPGRTAAGRTVTVRLAAIKLAAVEAAGVGWNRWLAQWGSSPVTGHNGGSRSAISWRPRPAVIDPSQPQPG